MDELSPLFQEIEFHERIRGYDPDEVDVFVDRVARAAAVMRGRIAELHERAEAAEARGAGTSAHSDTEETLTRTLVLAQRTADAAIVEAREEANRLTTDAATSAQAILSAAEAEAQLTLREAQAEASSTIKEAEDHAGLVLAEAETDRRAMVADAEAVAVEAAAAERERLAAEVSELHEYRAFLADDIEILERHLTEERHQLTSSLSALSDLLESPEAFRVSRPPATSGLEIDDVTIASIAAADPVVEFASADDEAEFSEPVVEEPVAEAAVVEEPVAEEAVVVEPEAEPEPVVAAAEESAEPEPVLAPPFVLAEEPEPVDETIDLVAGLEEAAEPFSAAVPESEPVDHAGAAHEIDLDDPDLDPGSSPEPSAPGPQPPGEPAFAGMVESSLAEAPRIEPAPSRLVTAADLEPSVATSGRLGFETSTFDRSFDDGGPVTEAVPALQENSLFAEPETADDPFLAQLRDAMEGEPMPPADDEALTAFFDQEDDDGGRSWFGRRR